MTCPYREVRRPTYAFRSPAQLSYIRHYVATLLDALASLNTDGEVVIDVDEIVESAGTVAPPISTPPRSANSAASRARRAGLATTFWATSGTAAAAEPGTTWRCFVLTWREYGASWSPGFRPSKS